MIIVIQCAASKQADAGCLRSRSKKPVLFVADPELAPTSEERLYARPDDLCEDGISWREMLLTYNASPFDNPLGLYPAYQLYRNRIYRRLIDRFGSDKVYILSAGWGLIAATFLTPNYDITFSPMAAGYKRRRRRDYYSDLCMLPNQTDEKIVFFGGKDYLPLFCSLTSGIRSQKTIFYNSARPLRAEGYVLERFETTTRTNWHYECANAFLN